MPDADYRASRRAGAATAWSAKGCVVSDVVGQADTVDELVALLCKFPGDTKVRARSLSHEWPVVVERHQLCVTVDMGS